MSPVDWGPGEYGSPPDPRPREVLPLLVSENSLPMGTSSHLPRDNLKGSPPAGALVTPTHGWGTRGSLSHLLPTLSLFLQCLGSVPDPRPTVISHHSSWPPVTLLSLWNQGVAPLQMSCDRTHRSRARTRLLRDHIQSKDWKLSEDILD